VIGDEGDASSSLIAILQGFTVGVKELPEASEGERKPAFPLTWYLFALWESDRVADVRKYRCELVSPRGATLFRQDGEFAFQPGKRFHRTSLKILGFPLDGFGDYRVVLSMGEADDSYTEVQTFPIPINPASA
jgi:hypothetical protein